MTMNPLVPIAQKELGEVFDQFTIAIDHFDPAFVGNELLELHSDPVILSLTRDRTFPFWEIGAILAPEDSHDIVFVRELMLGGQPLEESFEADSEFIRTHLAALKQLFSPKAIVVTLTRLRALQEKRFRQKYPGMFQS